MAINFQNIPVSFNQGVDTKSDPYQIPVGKLLELENAIFSKAGALSKRNGYDILSRIQLDTGEKITSSTTSTTFNNNLLLMDNVNLFSYSAGAEAWVNKGNLTSCQVSSNQIIHNSSNQANQDGAILDGIEVYVYEDISGGVYYSVVDYVTKTFIIQGSLLSATASHPKVIVTDINFIISYCELSTSQIIFSTISPLAPSNINTKKIIFDLDKTHPIYDLINMEGYSYLVYRNPSTLFLNILDNNLNKTDGVIIRSNATDCVTIYSSDNKDIWIAAGKNSSDEIDIFKYEYVDGGFYKSYGRQISSIGVDIVHITGGFIGNQSETTIVYAEINTGTAIGITYFLSGDQETEPALFKANVAINNKCFKYNKIIYLPIIYVTVGRTTFQATHFIVDCFGNVISKQNPNTASPRSNGLLAESAEISEGLFLLSELKQGELKSIKGKLFTEVGVVSSKISFVSEPDTTLNISWIPNQTSTLGNNLHISGGILNMFDGSTICEHGFLLYPEIPSNYIFVSTGGSIAAGNYQYMFTYEWTDNIGQIHRSAPSIPVEVTVPANGAVVFAVPTLTLTNKDSVRIVGYRTAEITTGSPIFYRFTSITAPVYNDTQTTTVLVSDNGLIWSQSNDIIYTTGGVLENMPAPACSLIHVFKNRLFVSGCEDPTVVYYSKTIVPGEPVSFNDNLFIKIDGKNNIITGLGSMDDHFIIFTRNSIYHLTGEGPDNTGLNNDFLDPQGISSPVGCINFASITSTSLGIIFKSSKGIYLLDRGFGTNYIGAPVEIYNNQTIVGAVDIPNDHQIRILCSDGNALVFDYFYQQWSTFTNHKATSCGIWNGSFYFTTDRGLVLVENTNPNGNYLDGTDPINIKITTGWLSFAGLQGYKRIKDILILGHYKGVNALDFTICYDGSEYRDGYVTFDSSVLYNNIYGENFVFGDNQTFGGTFNLEQIRLFPNKQKCQSIRLTIVERDSGNQGITFSGMNFTVGTKQSHAKINANAHKGAA